MDPEFLRARGAILHALRVGFARRGYLELQTPVLVPSPALEEHLDALRLAQAPSDPRPPWLHTSPEFAMKRALSSGLCRIYQIGPCFRDDEHGPYHSREFTMLEWYRVGASLDSLRQETEELVREAAAAVGRALPPFRVVATTSLLEPDLPPEVWFRRWVEDIEPTFDGAVFVTDYPAWQAALARVEGGLAKRFELYVDHLELANAFDEEVDPDALRARFEQSAATRRAAGKLPHPVDEELLEAVATLPRTAGIALGLDRLVMTLTGASDIRQVQVARRSDMR